MRKNIILLLILFSIPCFATEVKIVGYWSFDTHENGITPDASGYNNHGVVKNGATHVAGKYGNAFNFDGSNDYILINNSSKLNFANESFSWSFWTKKNRSTVQELIIGQGAGGPNAGLVLGFRNNDHFTFAFWSNDLDTVSYSDTQQWHHWVGTYDSETNARKIYRDGSIVASGTATNDYLGTGAIGIGGGAGGWSSSYFQGLIDEVAFWEGSLDSQEVQQVYNNGVMSISNIPEPVTVVLLFLSITAAFLLKKN